MNKAEMAVGGVYGAAGASALGFWLLPDRARIIAERKEALTEIYQEMYGRAPTPEELNLLRDEMNHTFLHDGSAYWFDREEFHDAFRDAARNTGNLEMTESSTYETPGFDETGALTKVTEIVEPREHILTVPEALTSDLWLNQGLVVFAALLTATGIFHAVGGAFRKN